ncbi:precorrin-2/cobalt-factor-2 C20-methyltransferase [Ardenticatena maritima]|uniref:Precorrin-2 C20-methyltransferase n=1 Tax=Ardenticatena maritima TaxID=872965 RepID=A0A0M8KAP5_9CHLR|nr:precorrin-2 C(20)-methyltransferase [Ardenticatena maritima]KPL87581.1 precorrin-2 C20-methyltransferase [Ardenticatena maritima]GAP63899.1 precorrin-2/cobalt-factor-2 C20-methyltransferase [Ardenticatena maritima]
MTATLTAVGVGPGDPELLTVKAVRVLDHADVVFVPRSRDGEESLALRIARPWLRADQRIVELPLPMTRDMDALRAAWRTAADTIAATLGDGAGAYILLGDPLLYGTFIYIAAALRERHPHIALRVVPGVPSFSAAAARAFFPLATTNNRVAILPASYETDAAALRRLLADFDTVILLKVGPVLPRIVAALREAGLLAHTIYAERVGMPEERIIHDITALPDAPAPYLSLLIVRRPEAERSETP